MARVYSAEEWVERFHKSGGKRKTTVVTIGNFDGVHLGHQAILRAAWESAGQSDGMSVALTFFPHPAKLLRPGDAPQLLMTLDQRLAAIEQLEIDATLVLRFDEQLAQLSAQEFVTKYLKQTLKTRSVVYGENFRFGHKGAGDASTLYNMGIELEPCPPVTVDGVVVSSTAIRTAIREGRVEEARRMLGRPYALEGEIRTGTGQGRKLVVPTLNLATEQEVAPKKWRVRHRSSRRGENLPRGDQRRHAAHIRRRAHHHRIVPVRLQRYADQRQDRSAILAAPARRAQVFWPSRAARAGAEGHRASEGLLQKSKPSDVTGERNYLFTQSRSRLLSPCNLRRCRQFPCARC